MKIWPLLLLLPASSLQAYPQPNTFYNEALVFYEQGDRGRAAYNLKKALALKPSHRAARALYSAIQNEIGGVPLSDNALTGFFISAANALPPQGDAAVSSFFFILGAILVAVKLLRYFPRKAKRWIVLCFAFSFCFALQGFLKYTFLFKKDVRIAVDAVNLLDEAAPEAKSLGEFPAGTEFQIMETSANGDYVLALGHNRLQGWALKKSLPPLWEK